MFRRLHCGSCQLNPVRLGLEDLPGLNPRPGQPVVLVVGERCDLGKGGLGADLVDDRVDLVLVQLLEAGVGAANAAVVGGPLREMLLGELEGGVVARGDDAAGVTAL